MKKSCRSRDSQIREGRQLSTDASALDDHNGRRNVTSTTTHLRKILKNI